VESGRRRDVRAGTLAALAAALGVTTDYLLLGRPGASMFDHRLLVYGSDDELVAAAAPFLAHAFEHSEGALAVASKRKISVLRRAVGRAAPGVRFAESSGWHTSPLAALNAYEEFCETSLGQGAAWVRIVSELDWACWSSSAARSWIRFDSLLNLVFANLPVSILCVCDAGSLRPAIGRQLSVTHPEATAIGGPAQVSPDSDPRALLL
jgi:transcriptional regulator with XRE-family HTH domain